MTIIDNALVQVGQNTAGNATLQVGKLTEFVTITAEAPLIRTTESTASTVVNENLIENLPLSGRRSTDFVLLTPNANADGDSGLVSMAGAAPIPAMPTATARTPLLLMEPTRPAITLAKPAGGPACPTCLGNNRFKNSR